MSYTRLLADEKEEDSQEKQIVLHAVVVSKKVQNLEELLIMESVNALSLQVEQLKALTEAFLTKIDFDNGVITNNYKTTLLPILK